MQKSFYYTIMHARADNVKAFFLSLFFAIGSFPRLLLELFIRKNFGERYFSLLSFSFLVVFLFSLPFTMNSSSGYEELGATISRHPLWYSYVAAFLFMGIKRYREIRLAPGVFDFSRFSVSNGELLPGFRRVWAAVWLKLFNRLPNPRVEEIFLEPLPFFALGFLCLGFEPMLGFLLMLCAILYSLSYWAAYKMGDDIVMNIIDDQIMAEETESIVVGDKRPEDARGVAFRFKKPTDPRLKETLADRLLVDDEPAASVY